MNDHWWTKCKTCGWARHSGLFKENAELKKTAHLKKNPMHVVEVKLGTEYSEEL